MRNEGKLKIFDLFRIRIGEMLLLSFSIIAEKCKDKTVKYIDAGISQHQAHVQVCMFMQFSSKCQYSERVPGVGMEA